MNPRWQRINTSPGSIFSKSPSFALISTVSVDRKCLFPVHGLRCIEYLRRISCAGRFRSEPGFLFSPESACNSAQALPSVLILPRAWQVSGGIHLIPAKSHLAAYRNEDDCRSVSLPSQLGNQLHSIHLVHQYIKKENVEPVTRADRIQNFSAICECRNAAVCAGGDFMHEEAYVR